MRYCASIIIPEGIFDMSLSQLDMFATQTRVLYHHIAFEHWQNFTKKREQIGKIRNVLSFFSDRIDKGEDLCYNECNRLHKCVRKEFSDV